METEESFTYGPHSLHVVVISKSLIQDKLIYFCKQVLTYLSSEQTPLIPGFDLSCNMPVDLLYVRSF